MAPLFNINWFEFSYLGTGIREAPGDPDPVRIFPNPSQGELFVEGTMESPLGGEILVFDITGQMVLKRNIQSGGFFREQLQLHSAGSYLVVLRDSVGMILSRRLVIIGL